MNDKISLSILHELQQLRVQLQNSFEMDEPPGASQPGLPALATIQRMCESISSPGRDHSHTIARNKVLSVFVRSPFKLLAGAELIQGSGVQGYARRVGELQRNFGWMIAGGMTVKDMLSEGDLELDGVDTQDIQSGQHVLLSCTQDTLAPYRWNVARDFRRSKGAASSKLLRYLQHNVGKPVTGEELRYVANDKTEWARRIRELRTEFGWAVVTKSTGRPDLPVGTYLLESLRQSPEHDRTISDYVRGSVLRRDSYKCTVCGWNKDLWDKSDPRHLELHHVKPHASGGENTEENLVTLCTLCHDQVHRGKQ